MIVVNRQEYKYHINQGQYYYIANVLRRFMRSDLHCLNTGDYRVRSLYFDSVDNDDLYDKISGINYRKKIRFRLYNTNDSMIKAEIKNKYNDYIYKETALLKKQEASNVILGNHDFLEKTSDVVLKKIYIYFKTQYIRPVTIIDYDREAYMLPFNNIRITVDKNIRANNYDYNLFDEGLTCIPIIDPNYYILEVKFDHFLPNIITELLSSCHLNRTSISKYCMARLLESSV